MKIEKIPCLVVCGKKPMINQSKWCVSQLTSESVVLENHNFIWLDLIFYSFKRLA